MEIVEVRLAALVVRLGEEVVQRLIDVCRSLCHQKDDDDDQHNHGDVVAFTTIFHV